MGRLRHVASEMSVVGPDVRVDGAVEVRAKPSGNQAGMRPVARGAASDRAGLRVAQARCRDDNHSHNAGDGVRPASAFKQIFHLEANCKDESIKSYSVC